MKRFSGILSIAGAVLAADQLTKAWVLRSFYPGESRVITSFFHFTYVHNTGTAFGLFQNQNAALSVLALVIIGGLLYASRGATERGGLPAFIGLGLVLGGAVGNLMDRIRLGQVVDFLDFRVWPVFNVADSAITVGTVLLMIGLWQGERAARHASHSA